MDVWLLKNSNIQVVDFESIEVELILFMLLRYLVILIDIVFK